ncbi:MAG: hypothetical protein Tsb002_10130 [Wenzhouxiangellaceae bacterium]
MNRLLPLLTTILFSSHAAISFAASEEGTGSPTVQSAISADQQLLLVVNNTSLTAMGSAPAGSGYAIIQLNALHDNGAVQMEWGRAEVSIGCGVIDLIIYRRDNNNWHEYLVDQLTSDYCPTP